MSVPRLKNPNSNFEGVVCLLSKKFVPMSVCCQIHDNFIVWYGMRLIKLMFDVLCHEIT